MKIHVALQSSLKCLEPGLYMESCYCKQQLQLNTVELYNLLDLQCCLCFYLRLLMVSPLFCWLDLNEHRDQEGAALAKHHKENKKLLVKNLITSVQNYGR